MIRRPTLIAAALAFATCAAAAEPLAEFEQIAGKCRAAVSSPFVQVLQVKQGPQAGQWVKRAFWPSAPVEFDVVKSASLVAPFTAWLSFGVGLAASRADSQDAAQALQLQQDQPQFTRQTVRLQFAYRGNAWQPVGGTYAYSMRTRAGEAFSAPTSVEIRSDAYADPLEMAGRCLTYRAE